MGMEIEMLDNPAAEAVQEAPVAALTVIERASIALDASNTEKALMALVEKSKTITEVKDSAGRAQCHRAAMDLADARIAIQKTGKSARDDATKFSKAVIAAEASLIAITQPEEARLLAIRNAWDEKIEAEKAAAAAAERSRVTAIATKITDIKAYAALAMQCRTSERVAGLIAKVADMPITAEVFAEFEDEAIEAKRVTMEQMEQVEQRLQADEAERSRIKAEQEAEAARLAAERAELARQQAEAAAAQAKAAADLKAAQEAQAKADQEAAAARAAAEAEAQAKRDAEAAELQRQRDAFAAEQSAARAAQQAEAARLQAQADELARQRAELEPKPDVPTVERSSDAIETEANHIPDAGDMVAEPEAIQEPEADPLPVTMEEPAPAEPSDAQIIWTAATALTYTYGWSTAESIRRLSAIDWQVA